MKLPNERKRLQRIDSNINKIKRWFIWYLSIGVVSLVLLRSSEFLGLQTSPLDMYWVQLYSPLILLFFLSFIAGPVALLSTKAKESDIITQECLVMENTWLAAISYWLIFVLATLFYGFIGLEVLDIFGLITLDKAYDGDFINDLLKVGKRLSKYGAILYSLIIITILIKKTCELDKLKDRLS